MMPQALMGDPYGLVIVDWSLLVRMAWEVDGVHGTASRVLGRLWRLLSDPMPVSMCIAVDPERVDPETGQAVRRRTWRDRATDHLPEKEQYKAGRIPKPPELVRIERRMFEVVAALRIPFLLPENPAYEQDYDADDAMATACRLARLERRSVAILTRDKDMLQSVTDEAPRVVRWWPFLTRQESDNGEPEEHDEKSVFRKLDVQPSQVCDYLAIMGDKGDNIPGAKGVGKKGAAKILFDHGSLDACLAREPITRTEKLVHEQREAVIASRNLVRLWDEAPIRWDPARQMTGGFDVDKLRRVLQDFGFSRMADELPVFKKPAYEPREVLF
jgi:5'-3' exonuclease